MLPPRIGFVTIGQSPRRDIVPGLTKILPKKITVVESGALDGLGQQDIDALAPRDHDYPLYTRLADGQSVTVAKSLIVPRMQACIDQLNADGVAIIALLCSGVFPDFQSRAPLLLPNTLVDNVIQETLQKRRGVAVLLPLASQIKTIQKYFHNDTNLRLFSLAPSAHNAAIDEVVLRLQESQVDLILLRCFSYSWAMKDAIAVGTSQPTLLARSLLVDDLTQRINAL